MHSLLVNFREHEKLATILNKALKICSYSKNWLKRWQLFLKKHLKSCSYS
jgi:hypothetical protein